MQNLQTAQQHVQSVIRRLEAIEENTGTRCNSPESILEALMEMFRYKDIPRMVDELKQVYLYLESKMTPVAAEVESKTFK
ncbi:hypothetical protein [Paenibacillus ottowii]